MEDDKRKKELFLSQKKLLDTFLSTGAITEEQYEKSLSGLCTKMGLDREGNGKK